MCTDCTTLLGYAYEFVHHTYSQEREKLHFRDADDVILNPAKSKKQKTRIDLFFYDDM